jgi:hypothetical protein
MITSGDLTVNLLYCWGKKNPKYSLERKAWSSSENGSKEENRNCSTENQILATQSLARHYTDWPTTAHFQKAVPTITECIIIHFNTCWDCKDGRVTKEMYKPPQLTWFGHEAEVIMTERFSWCCSHTFLRDHQHLSVGSHPITYTSVSQNDFAILAWCNWQAQCKLPHLEHWAPLCKYYVQSYKASKNKCIYMFLQLNLFVTLIQHTVC